MKNGHNTGGIFDILPTMAEEREFIDEQEHPGFDRYRALVEAFHGNETDAFVDDLRALIEEDPFYLDPYLLTVEFLEELELHDEAAYMLEKAYQRAVDLVTAEDGNWPDKLRWGFVENRHIIRTLVSKAVFYWKSDQNEEALELFGRLLKMNPNDNAGNRYFILGILTGMSFQEFTDRFDKGGYYDNEIDEWFNDHYTKFPDELGGWDGE